MYLKGSKSHSVSTRAAAVSYNFYLAFFPTLIFLFSLIPYVPIDNFQAELLLLIRQLLPKNAMSNLQATLEDVIVKKHTSLLSVSLLSIVYFAQNGVNSLINSFNASAHTEEHRNWWQQRLVSLMLMGLMSALMLVGVSLWIVTQFMASYILTKQWTEWVPTIPLLLVGRWVIIMLLFFVAISSMYYFAPARQERWRFFSVGSVMATFFSLVISVGFSVYVNNFGQYNQLYGSIGTMMVIMLWIYFNALVLLLGYDLNSSIRRAQRDRQL
jgi:membrane protein